MSAPQPTAIADQPPRHLATLLTNHPLFSALPVAALNHFADKSQMVSFEKGQTVFLQSEEADWFYLILSGWLKIYRETPDGQEVIIDILSGGALIAADSLFGDGHYESAAETIEPAQAIRIPLSLLRYYVEKDHAVALRMLKMLSADQKQRSREIEHLNIQNAPQRIACFLLRLWRQQKSDLTPHLDLPYDKTLIAARLGMRPETFSRALNKLQKDTDLSINGARVDLSQIDQLGTYACQNCSALNTADYIASPAARPHETEDPTHTNQCRVSDPKNS